MNYRGFLSEDEGKQKYRLNRLQLSLQKFLLFFTPAVVCWEIVNFHCWLISIDKAIMSAWITFLSTWMVILLFNVCNCVHFIVTYKVCAFLFPKDKCKWKSNMAAMFNHLPSSQISCAILTFPLVVFHLISHFLAVVFHFFLFSFSENFVFEWQHLL